MHTLFQRNGPVHIDLQIFDDTLTWFVRAMQPHGCVNTHHLGDFLMRLDVAGSFTLVCKVICINWNYTQINLCTRLHFWKVNASLECILYLKSKCRSINNFGLIEAASWIGPCHIHAGVHASLSIYKPESIPRSGYVFPSLCPTALLINIHCVWSTTNFHDFLHSPEGPEWILE